MDHDAGSDGEPVDPSSRARDHMANERTFLAWLRTAANVMIVGLVVARFGGGGRVTAATLGAGALLVVVGTAGVAYGAARYRAVSRELETGTHVTGAQAAGPTRAALVLVLAVLVAMVLLLGDGLD